ncbi:DUF2207 domain-containing protein, partial [Candidatus Woesebacteria bacterium]|nr:DUF2207 domain-containing protein [Candidatus Woesebacteria bacterium]
MRVTRWLITLFVCCVAGLTLLALPPPLFAKSYDISEVSISAQLDDSGVMSVSEERTYHFDGNFSFVYQYIPKESNYSGRSKTYQIENIQLCEGTTCYQELPGARASELDVLREPGTFYVIDGGDEYYVRWFYRAQDEERRFTLSYDVVGAVTAHQDVQELYWQWVGGGWEVPQNNISVRLRVPEQLSSAVMQAWSHGPLDGVVARPEDELVTFTTPFLPPGEFVEGRVLFAPKTFTNTASGTLSESEIRAEEQRFQDETQRQQQASYTQQLFFSMLFFGALVIQMALIWKTITHFWKTGKEVPLPAANLADRLWEPPSDLEPAIVEQVIRISQNLTPKAFTATVLTLVRDGFVRVHRSAKKTGTIFKNYEYFLEFVTRENDPSELQQSVLSFLHTVPLKKSAHVESTAPLLSLKELPKYIKKDPKYASAFFPGFGMLSHRQAVAQGFLTGSSLKDGWYAGLLIFSIFSVAFFTSLFADRLEQELPIMPFSLEVSVIALFGLVGLAVCGIITASLALAFAEKRTKKGAETAAEWLAFKKHIEEYRVTADAPIDSLVMWENYLVYGTVLGVSEQVLK